MGLDAVEDRGRNRGVTCISQEIEHRADVVIDAKDLLDHHDRAFGRTRRVRAIAAKFKTVRSRQLDVLSHGSSIAFWGCTKSVCEDEDGRGLLPHPVVDRKSTRLNSS